jgi:regulatory protein
MAMRAREQRKLATDELLQYAVRSLAARAQSAGELRSKLARRAAVDSDVEAVLTRLKEYGYLNEARFAENFVTARRDTDGLGPIRVLRDLRQRRVAPKLAEQTVQSAYQDVNETELIERYVRRMFRNHERGTLFQSDKDLAAAYNRLRRAGFASGPSVTVLKRFAKNPELLDAIDDAAVEETE